MTTIEVLNKLIKDVEEHRDGMAGRWAELDDESDPTGRQRSHWNGARGALDVTLWRLRVQLHDAERD